MDNIEGNISTDGKSRLWDIVAVASIAAGVQFGWALQLSLLTPYVQTLGVPHTWAAFIWLCGPISGLIVQPTVGYFSDRNTSRFGRRRPFICGGAAFVVIAVFLIGFAKDIGYRAGDSLDQPTKPRAVAIFVSGFWCLDVANNMLQGPCRALLADLSSNDHRLMRISNGCFSFFMAVGNILGYAAGSYSDLHKRLSFLHTSTVSCDVYCANLKTCFIIDAVFLLSVTIFAVLRVKETPLSKGEIDRSHEEKAVPCFGGISTALRTMKKPMWILLLVTCLNWIAWFPFLLFDTDWMGKEVYGGKPKGNEMEKELYESGVRLGSRGLMINSAVLGLSSLGLERAGQLVGGVQNLWGAVNFLLCACLVMLVPITKAAERWRSRNWPPLKGPPPSIKGAALSIFGGLGIPLSVTFSIPFALASIYCSDAGGGQGLSLGVLNMSIVVPQMFVSVISGPLDAAFGGGNLAAFVMGAGAAAVSAVLAIWVLPKPPNDEVPSATPVLPAAAAPH